MLFFNDFNTLLHTAVLSWLPCAQKNGVSRVCRRWKEINNTATLSNKYSVLIRHPLNFLEKPFCTPDTLFNLGEILKKDPELNAFSKKAQEFLYPFAVANNIIPLTPAINENKVFILAAALGNKQKLVELKSEKTISVAAQNEAFTMAAQFGELECLQYLDNETISHQETAFHYAAGTYGIVSFSHTITWNNFPCLKYLFDKHSHSITFSSLEVAIVSTAGCDQHLPSLKYLCDFLERHSLFFRENSKREIYFLSSPLCKEYLNTFFEDAYKLQKELTSQQGPESVTHIEDLINAKKMVAEVIKEPEQVDDRRRPTFSCSPF